MNASTPLMQPLVLAAIERLVIYIRSDEQLAVQLHTIGELAAKATVEAAGTEMTNEQKFTYGLCVVIGCWNLLNEANIGKDAE